ncbi:hypothetical protein Zmor_004920 [Zophobas morio]|uniref:Uncharacterized protein n=1 Tax=Zophobas morio TaxID=2755281 RepID=A0AA38MLP5_9CUCU|nr:hypothetical protein Zmor_004920 [Zophobas morio]
MKNRRQRITLSALLRAGFRDYPPRTFPKRKDSHCGEPCSVETRHNKTGIVKPLIKPTLELQRCILNTPLYTCFNVGREMGRGWRGPHWKENRF